MILELLRAVLWLLRNLNVSVQNESVFLWGLARDLLALKRSLGLDDDKHLLSNLFF